MAHGLGSDFTQVMEGFGLRGIPSFTSLLTRLQTRDNRKASRTKINDELLHAQPWLLS